MINKKAIIGMCSTIVVAAAAHVTVAVLNSIKNRKKSDVV